MASQIRTISLTKEADSILSNLKNNPDFNFSAWVCAHLENYAGDRLDESTILERKAEAEQMIKKGQDLIAIWNKKGEELAIKKAFAKKAAEEKAKEEKQELEYKEHMLEINRYLQGLGPESPLWAEYQEGIKANKWKGSIEFAKSKLNYV